MKYYDLPLDFENLTNGKKLPRITFEDSIRNYISLICTTSLGEMFSDGDFGAIIWDMDFDNISNTNKVVDILRDSIIKSISGYEKRSLLAELDISLSQVLIKKGNKKMKTKIILDFDLINTRLETRFTHKEEFFIGPLSYTA